MFQSPTTVPLRSISAAIPENPLPARWCLNWEVTNTRILEVAEVGVIVAVNEVVVSAVVAIVVCVVVVALITCRSFPPPAGATHFKPVASTLSATNGGLCLAQSHRIVLREQEPGFLGADAQAI